MMGTILRCGGSTVGIIYNCSPCIPREIILRKHFISKSDFVCGGAVHNFEVMHVLKRLCSIWVKVTETELREAFIANIFVKNAIDLLIPECFVGVSFQFFWCSKNT